MNNRTAFAKTPNERMQIEYNMWVVERPDHHCGDDLFPTNPPIFTRPSLRSKKSANITGAISRQNAGWRSALRDDLRPPSFVRRRRHSSITK